MAALDLLEQLRARALDPVAADAPADRLIFGDRDRLGGRRRRAAAPPAPPSRSRPRPARRRSIDDRGRMEIVGAAAERAQLGRAPRRARPGLLSIVPSSQLEHLVGAEHQRIAGAGDAAAPSSRPASRRGRAARSRRRPGRPWPPPRRASASTALERDAGRLEHAPAGRALRGEQQPHSRRPLAAARHRA